MEKLLAVRVEKNEIVVADSHTLSKLFDLINNESNVILEWPEKDKTKSEIFVTEGLITRIKDGTLKLRAEETRGKK